MNLDGVLIPVWWRGRVVAWSVVDEEDLARVDTHRWAYEKNFYGAACYDREYGGTVGMHRFIMRVPMFDPRVVHHINEARLDNRKANLQVCADAYEHVHLPHAFRDRYAPRAYQARLRAKKAAA